jgi:hypothetical protein
MRVDFSEWQEVMSQENSLILPPTFPPQQAQSFVLDWLIANPIAPLDIASATFDPAQLILVPVAFIKATASAGFSGRVSYEERNAPRIQNHEDDPVEVQRTSMSGGGRVEISVQDLAMLRLQGLPAAPGYRLSQARAAQVEELSLPRLNPNLSTAEWNERLRQQVEGGLRSAAKDQIRDQAPYNADNVTVDRVDLYGMEVNIHESIEAWVAFYHLRYHYQDQVVDVLVDGQTRAPAGQRLKSTMRAWEASEKSRKRSLVQLVLVALVLLPVAGLAGLLILNSPDGNALVFGIAALLFIGVYFGLFKAIRSLLKPIPKPESDQAEREGEDVGKLLSALVK